MFPDRHAHHGQFEPDLLQSTAVVLTGTSTFQPGSGSLAPLAYVEESLHNDFSAEGLIISLAF
jgi:hypothetical protein